MKEKDIEKKKSRKGTVAAALTGTALGVGLGILFAPKSGKETREDLSIAMKKMLENVKTLTSQEKRDEFSKKIKKLEKEIQELDKEKVLKIAKKKADSIKNKTEELVQMAKEKGNETLEKTAEDLREKAISVAKAVINKLEEK